MSNRDRLSELANQGCKGYSQMTKAELLEFVLNCKKPSSQSSSSGAKVQTSELTVAQLRELAKRKGCKGYSKMKKAELLEFVKNCESKKVKDSQKPSAPKESPRQLTVVQLRELAKRKGCKGYSKMKKAELLEFVKNCGRPKSPSFRPPTPPESKIEDLPSSRSSRKPLSRTSSKSSSTQTLSYRSSSSSLNEPTYENIRKDVIKVVTEMYENGLSQQIMTRKKLRKPIPLEDFLRHNEDGIDIIVESILQDYRNDPDSFDGSQDTIGELTMNIFDDYIKTDL